MEYGSAIKMNELWYNNLDVSQGQYAEWKKLVWKGHLLHDSIYINNKNYWDEEQSSSCKGLGMVLGVEMWQQRMTVKGWHEGELCGDAIILYFIVVVVTQGYTSLMTELYTCIPSISFLGFTLNCSCVRYNHCRKVGEGYMGLLCIILMTSCESVVISK